jgi:cytochrome b561
MADLAHEVSAQAYAPTARRFHWWTAALVAIQITIGLTMTYRAGVLKAFDAITNSLYSTHKLLGVAIFFLVLTRLAYRLRHGAPPDEPSLTRWQRIAAHANHWGLYVLLLAVPVLGYIATSYFGALDAFGLALPVVTPHSEDAAAGIFVLHYLGALLILLLVTVHIAAALFHFFIRRDGVLARMLPAAGRRG